MLPKAMHQAMLPWNFVPFEKRGSEKSNSLCYQVHSICAVVWEWLVRISIKISLNYRSALFCEETVQVEIRFFMLFHGFEIR